MKYMVKFLDLKHYAKLLYINNITKYKWGVVN